MASTQEPHYTTELETNETPTSMKTMLMISAEDEFWHYKVYRSLFLYASPFILVLGLFGNVFAFAVLQNRRMRTSAASFLLSALAVSDTGCLLTELVNNWVKEITGYRVDIRSYNIHTCRLHMFLTFLFHHLSPITLMLLTMQRAVCVARPLQAKVICSRGNIIKVWIVAASACSAYNSMAFFCVTYDTIVASLNMSCFYNETVIGFFDAVDSLLECFLPCTVVVIGNVVIIVKVKQAAETRLTTSQTAENQAQTERSEALNTMLIIVSSTFVLLTCPFYIWANGTYIWNYRANGTLNQAQSYLFYAIAYHLLELNFSINFILYCMFGRRFRSAVRDMIGQGSEKSFTSH